MEDLIEDGNGLGLIEKLSKYGDRSMYPVSVALPKDSTANFSFSGLGSIFMKRIFKPDETMNVTGEEEISFSDQ